MRIGISVSSSHHVEDSREGARNMIERTRAARDAGLDSLFVGDHHVTPFPYYQNNVILARMLAEWGDKPFGALYLLPLWHPVLLAEQVGTLASLAEGPFIMQCGLGDARQGEALGIDMSRKVGMFTESIRVLRTLWRGESVSENRYWNIQEARISPIPPQHVDIWVGATVDAAIERTAKLAEAWLANPGSTSNEAGEAVGRYLGYCEKHGRQPTAIAIRKDVYVGSSSEEAKATVKPYIEKGYRGIAPEALLVGSIEEVAGQLRTLQGQGYTDVIVRNISTNQHECLDCIHRLAEVRTMLEG